MCARRFSWPSVRTRTARASKTPRAGLPTTGPILSSISRATSPPPSTASAPIRWSSSQACASIPSVSITSCPSGVRSPSDQKVLGLSKFARIAHKHAHQLQVQERLVEQIANEVKEAVRCEDVAVIGRGEHSCMVARGIKTPALMTSSVLFGRFKHDAAMRAEFLSIAGF
jgi:hypothetical protein